MLGAPLSLAHKGKSFANAKQVIRVFFILKLNHKFLKFDNIFLPIFQNCFTSVYFMSVNCNSRTGVDSYIIIITGTELYLYSPKNNYQHFKIVRTNLHQEQGVEEIRCTECKVCPRNQSVVG